MKQKGITALRSAAFAALIVGILALGWAAGGLADRLVPGHDGETTLQAARPLPGVLGKSDRLYEPYPWNELETGDEQRQALLRLTSAEEAERAVEDMWAAPVNSTLYAAGLPAGQFVGMRGWTEHGFPAPADGRVQLPVYARLGDNGEADAIYVKDYPVLAQDKKLYLSAVVLVDKGLAADYHLRPAQPRTPDARQMDRALETVKSDLYLLLTDAIRSPLLYRLTELAAQNAPPPLPGREELEAAKNEDDREKLIDTYWKALEQIDRQGWEIYLLESLQELGFLWMGPEQKAALEKADLNGDPVALVQWWYGYNAPEWRGLWVQLVQYGDEVAVMFTIDRPKSETRPESESVTLVLYYSPELESYNGFTVWVGEPLQQETVN